MQIHLPSPSHCAGSSCDVGRTQDKLPPIVFMHKTWHRRLPSPQLLAGRLGAQGKKGKESYKIKEVNGSPRYKKGEEGFVFFLMFIHWLRLPVSLGGFVHLPWEGLRPTLEPWCYRRDYTGSETGHGGTGSGGGS